MYRIYVRTHTQVAHHKTVTPSPVVAEAAFRELMLMRKFWATRASAILSLDGRQLECRRFDRIVPVDEDLAESLRRGDEMPHWPRYIYPLDREVLATLGTSGYLLCRVIQRGDTPIFDADEPVRLFHE